MALSLDPSSNPVLRLYQLFDQPGVVTEDGPFYLGFKNLHLKDLGSERTRELIQFLSQAAFSALRSYRLTLDKQPIANLASSLAKDVVEQSTIDELVRQHRLNEDCYEILIEWRNLLDQYDESSCWPPHGDPLLDYPTVLDELTAYEDSERPFALEVSLDKTVLAEEHLLGGLPDLSEKVSALVWHSPTSLRQAFDDFHGLLAYVARAADRPVVLFFYEPTELYLGDFFKILPLCTTTEDCADREATLTEQLQAFTPQLLAEYDELRGRQKYESRPNVGQRFDLPAGLFLRRDGHMSSYPPHALFLEGPVRPLLVYALMAWLAERTELENGSMCFTLPSSNKVILDFDMKDVHWNGTSLFATKTDWQNILLQLTRDVYRSAGCNSLRELWARALGDWPADDLTDVDLLSSLEAVRSKFVELEQEPLIVSGKSPDLELFVFLDAENNQIEFKLHSTSRLPFIYESVGEISVGQDDPSRRFSNLSQLAKQYLTRLVPDESPPGVVLPDVGELESWGRDLWAMIPEKLQKHYVKFREEKNLGILVVSTDPSFPWELVKPDAPKGKLAPTRIDDPYWAMQFNLARWLAGHPSPASEIRFDRVCCVAATSDLPSAIREIEFFRGIGVEPDQPKTWNDLHRLLCQNQYDVIHLSCHGKFDSDQPIESVIRLPDGTALEPRHIKKAAIWEMIRESRPLIFLNVCHSGRVGPTLTGLGGFAKCFIDMECGAFIGCGWEVSDPQAAEFAIAFYERFRNGEPLGQAVRSARYKVKDETNSTWLAYYLYGHPYCCFRESPRVNRIPVR